MINIGNLKLPNHSMLCVDMKSFFASVECVKRGMDPLLTYLAVVGTLERSGSVVLASSPMMKKEFKIKTGNRLYEIPDDPRIHIVNASMGDYLNVSMCITQILSQYAPLEAIFCYSVDESFICLDGTERLFGNRFRAAERIQNHILASTGIPSSIGIGPNRFLSKVILDVESKKSPSGIAECGYEDVPSKLWKIPVQDIWGIGSRMQRSLNQLGIYVLGDLAGTPLDRLRRKFGVMGEQMYYHSHGIDLSPAFVPWKEGENKGYSHGVTLFRDYKLTEIHRVLIDLLDDVTRRLRKILAAARTISVYIGYSRDTGIGGFSKSRTLSEATNITNKFLMVCEELLRDAVDAPIRNVYVSATNLIDENQIQLNLFEDPELDNKRHKLGLVRDQLQDKYGRPVLFRASSFSESGIAVERSNKIGGHSQ